MNITRRQFVPLAAASAMAAFGVAGCSNDTASTATGSTPAADTGSADASSDGELTLFESGKLTFATSPDYPPFENLEDGEYVGLDMDLGRAIADYLGLECVYTNIDFDGIIPAIVAGGQADAGLSGISITPEREEQVLFTDPYYIDNQAVAVMSDNTEITEDNAAEALNNEAVTIAVQSGSTGADFAAENFPNAEQLPFPNFTDAFAAVQAGQADAVCGNKAVVDQMLAGAYSDEHTVLTSATGEEYAIAVSQDNPDLVDAMNEAIAALTEDGTLDEIIANNMG
ncbi:ABC transporter substrate-binding protein [Collinsella ihumii]|uniref:ABC transporter substrate-binding protein n=1 Tax=Collinsella ihumii TaxID=1720204 RepID=A0ABT7XEB1_9ACTN|nr:ABC transporter substrate-binding protein [Collinsella ihumii]MBM6777345.1 amino acid ABC transporter substrate-binding protein [Collinsella tanakaei]MCF6413092.1 amino acid ABC transporter substrate-binding protein [Collinsella tanakaei]MDN0063757.1 ABC transporter substrate-binding protein [Collinsella ihumii]